MDQLNGKKILISGLISSKLNIDEFLTPIRITVTKLGGEIIGEFIQRRGVSRSKTTGGSRKLNSPLSSQTYISLGKATELRELSNKLNPDLIIFINNLTIAQINNLESLTETKIQVLEMK